MATALDRKGHFRVVINSYGLEKARESNAYSVVLQCTVLEQYDFDTGAWTDWRGFDEHEVWGRVNIIKKDSTVNKLGCESLIKNAGWDGDLMSLQNKTWEPFQCSVSVKEETWEGKTQFKIGFVNGWDDVPSGNLGNLDETQAKALATQFAAPLRAIAGTLKQNFAKPNGKPASPPMRVPTEKELAALPAEDSQIPF